MTVSDRDPVALREWIRRQADDLGLDPGDLLIQSKRRDPMWKGTDADFAKAEWFAEWWRRAVDGRGEDRIHVRGVHYYMVSADEVIEPPTDCSWDVYQNTERCYNYLESAAVLARILGTIPLGGIEDQKHDQFVVHRYEDHTVEPDLTEIDVPTGVETPAVPEPSARAALAFADDPDAADAEAFAEYLAEEMAADLVDQLHFDGPRQQPFHLELWSEKTLPEYIHDVATNHGVNVVVEGEGDLSLTIAHELVRRIDAAGKPAVILYLSDFDPKGDNMAAAMAGKLAWLKQRGDLSERVLVTQLALTAEQVEDLGLPRKPIEDSNHTGTGGKAYNTLISEWEERRGHGATELNALEAQPDLFEQVVRDGLAPFVDEDLPVKNDRAREQFVADVRAEVRDTLLDAGLGDDLESLRAWVGEFNAALADAEDVLADLRRRKHGDDSALQAWRRRVGHAVADVGVPAAEAPLGEAAFPDDPLYDSDREYAENLLRVDEHRNGG